MKLNLQLSGSFALVMMSLFAIIVSSSIEIISMDYSESLTAESPHQSLLSRFLKQYPSSWIDHSDVLEFHFHNIQKNRDNNVDTFIIIHEARNGEEFDSLQYIQSEKSVNYTKAFNFSRALLLYLNSQFENFELFFIYYHYGMTKLVKCYKNIEKNQNTNWAYYSCDLFKPWSILAALQSLMRVTTTYLNNFPPNHESDSKIRMIIDTRQNTQQIVETSLKTKLWHSYDVIDVILNNLRNIYKINDFQPFDYLVQYNDNTCKSVDAQLDADCYNAIDINSQSNNSPQTVSYQESEYNLTSKMLYPSNDYWITISDIVILRFQKLQDVLVNLHNNEKSNVIIFIETSLLVIYIDYLKELNYPYILISNDIMPYCLPYFKYPQNDPTIVSKIDELLDSTNLVIWYAKNVVISHSKLRPIPLGPRFHSMSEMFFGEPKQATIDILSRHCLTPYEKFTNRTLKTSLLYFNFNNATTGHPYYSSHQNIRHTIYEVLQMNNFSYVNSSPFEEYLTILSTYRFCMSPPGTGIDTHRAWECLMVGTIPILISSPLDILFDDLPVLFVHIEDLSRITVDYLNQKYMEITHENNHYNFEKLYTSYWKKKILSHREEDKA